MKRARMAAVIAIILSTLLTACTGGSGEDNGGATLEVGYTAELNGLDPSTRDGAAISMVFLYNVYETLVKDNGEGEIVPGLAESWDVSDDRLTYTFHLAENAAFASGEPLDAAAVVTSIEYIQAGEGGDAPVRPLLIDQMSPVASAEAIDDQTVEITLTEPSNTWLYNMTGPAGIVYDPEGLDNLNAEPKGSGPFQFVDWDTGSQLTLERNPNYWAEAPNVDEVVFKVFSDPNAMTSAMLSGQLDIISNLTTPESLGQFDDAERYTVLEGYSNGEVVLGYNHETEALKDARVRQAITHAIDRQGLLDSVWGGKGSLIGSMVPPQDAWYEDLSELYPYDPERAEELLAEAGYASGLTLNLRVPVLPYATSGGRYVASQLEEVGISVTLEEVEMAVWLEDVFTDGNYDLTIISHLEPRDLSMYADPDYYWHYDNPEFQDLVAQADQATPEEEAELLKQAARLLADDAASTWLFLLPNIIITTPEITGISANATNLSFDLTNVSVGTE